MNQDVYFLNLSYFSSFDLCKPEEMCSSKSLDNLISLDVEDKDRTGANVDRNIGGEICELTKQMETLNASVKDAFHTHTQVSLNILSVEVYFPYI
jgi:hypothetical protein